MPSSSPLLLAPALKATSLGTPLPPAVRVQYATSVEVAFHAAPIGLCVLDLSFRYLTVNLCFTTMYGLREEDFLGRSVEEALPEPAPQILAHMRLALEQNCVVEREIALQDPSAALLGGTARELIYLRTATPVRNADGTVFGIAVALSDITERKRLDSALKASEEDLRYTVELTPHIPWTADPNGEIIFISPRWNGLVGLPPGPVLLAGWAECLHAEDRNRAANVWFTSVRSGCPYDVEYRVHTPHSGWRWVRARAYPRLLPGGGILRWYGTVEDIHDRKAIDLELQQATEEIARRALQDHLTSLANRRQFDQVLAGEIDRAHRTGLPLALVLIDIDHFKLFNDIAGHLVGDECLKTVAQTLAHIIQHPTDLVARFGGEEFALVLPSTDLEGAILLAQRVVDAVAELHLHHTDPRVQRVTISAGVAMYRHNAQFHRAGSMPLLIEAADIALYQAKRRGRNCVFHEDQPPV